MKYLVVLEKGEPSAGEREGKPLASKGLATGRSFRIWSSSRRQGPVTSSHLARGERERELLPPLDRGFELAVRFHVFLEIKGRGSAAVLAAEGDREGAMK